MLDVTVSSSLEVEAVAQQRPSEFSWKSCSVVVETSSFPKQFRKQNCRENDQRPRQNSGYCDCFKEQHFGN
jgi:hypothetical protein